MHIALRTLAVAGLVASAWFPSAVSAAVPGNLIKLSCPAGAAADHPCRAVYHWGGDGMRHAFPNAKVYFTWYADFSGVQIVSATDMAAIRLGSNVTYRPGAKLVKLQTINDVYAVDTDAVLRPIASEEAAVSAFGSAWNKDIHDLPEVFFTDYRLGAPISSAADFDAASRLAAAPNLDAASGATYSFGKVQTAAGAFDAHVVTLDAAKYRMKTLVASDEDCSNGCAAESLADHASEVSAPIAMNGTYFCPPDYADCASKTYSFLWPMYDSPSGEMRNAGNIKFHQGPMLASAVNGKFAFFRDARTYSAGQVQSTTGSTLDAAIANYPALMAGGTVVVASDPMLDDGQRTIKGTRGGIGVSSGKIFMVVARNATVIDLAEVMRTLGATDAINLDGGGSSALLYGGTYKVGPGRLLPNAVAFVKVAP